MTTRNATPIASNSAAAQLIEAQKRIAELEQKLASKSTNTGELRVRFNNSVTKDPKTGQSVAGKLGFSVLGLNAKFPVTLYATQWVKLLKIAPVLIDCIAQNVEECAVKDEAERAQLAADVEALSAAFGEPAKS